MHLKLFSLFEKNQTLVLEVVFILVQQKKFCKKIKKKFKIEKFFLAYSPERIDPGKPINTKIRLSKYYKLVAGYTIKCEKKILKLYSSIFKNIYLCKSIMVVETSKIFENIFKRKYRACK